MYIGSNWPWLKLKPYKVASVAPSDWFYPAVKYVVENNLMTGTGATAFAPDLLTTRSMLVSILWRMEGSPAQNTLSSFSDVASDVWYAKAVAWAADNKIVAGLSADTFSPDTPITREQLASILYRYAKLKGYDVSVGEDTNILSYDDALTIPEYAIPALQWTCGAGIMDGRTTRTLAPGGTATRAEVTTIIMRFLENVAKQVIA